MSQKNAILIIFDQLMNYNFLPQKIRDLLPGYNAFKNIGVDYSNVSINRTACSPSRAVIQSGFIDTGIQDSVNSEYQQLIPRLNPLFDTAAKLFKRNGYMTAYVGKQHIDDSLNVTAYTQPRFCTNTRGSMKTYGYDTFNTFGDAIGYQKGFLVDAQFLELNMPPNSEEYDYYNVATNTKQNGILPYLKARKEDGKTFYLEFHLTNPHDIHECKMNVSNASSGASHQFYFPFMKEQLEEAGIPQENSPYYYNNEFQDAFIKNINLQTNYFEDNYNDYKTNIDSLPFLNSFVYDFCLDPVTNKVNPMYVGFYEFFRTWTTSAEQTDIKTWKNLVNTYYGLIIEADSYLYKIYLEMEQLGFLENTCVIISADHGECASSHGQRSKAIPFKENVNVPLLIYDKDLKEKNILSEYICSSIDIIPTFATLCNISLDTSPQFIGTSILYKENNLFNTKINTDETNSIFYTNNSDALLSYYLYIFWFLKLSDKSIVHKPPPNIFAFQYAYTMVTKKYNNKLYKYGRFFSLIDLLNANIDINYTITKKYLFNVIDLYILKGYTYYIDIRKVFDKIFPDGEFPILEGLNIIYDKINRLDTTYLYTYLSIVFDKLNVEFAYKYYTPGYNKDFNTINSENKLNLFCYNLTDDSSEIYNLLDPKNYNSINDPIFENLNSSLNVNLAKLYMDRVVYLIPTSTFLEIINNFYTSIGNSIDNIDITFLSKISNITTYNGIENYVIQPESLFDPFTFTFVDQNL
jgi:arylsulfatase A-like enzyme